MKITDKKTNNKLLSYLIKSLLLDVADNYLIKTKKDNKKPPEAIAKYFQQAIFLTKQKKIKIKKISNKLQIMDKKNEKEFNTFIKSDKDYNKLFKELNFIFNLIKNKELQTKVINEINEIIIDSKKTYEPIKKTQEKVFNFNPFLFNLNKNNNVYLTQYK